MAFTYLKVKSANCEVPLFTSGGLGLGLVIFGLGLGLVSSGLGLGLKNLVLFTSLV